jgi:lanosterol synthase
MFPELEYFLHILHILFLHCSTLESWEGVNPVPPELWLLPEMLPFHPWRWWVHSRQVYLPISYLYGKRLQVELDPTLASLRHELYTQPYESINWPRCRNLVAKEDLYSPRHPIANGLFWILGYWEKICPSSIRNMGLVGPFLLGDKPFHQFSN